MYKQYKLTVSKNIRRMANRMTAQMKPHIFDPFEPILIIVLTWNFKFACDINGILKEVQRFGCSTSSWRDQHQQYSTVGWVPNKRLKQDCHQLERPPTLLTFQLFFNYFLCAYTTNGNIADTEDEKTVLSYPSNKTPLQYAKEQVAKKLWREDVYEEHDLKEIFIRGLNESIPAEASLIKQESRDYSNLIAIGSGSLMTHSSSTEPFPNQSSAKRWTNKFDSCALWLYKMHRIQDCLLILQDQNIRLAQVWHLNVRGKHRGDANQYDAPRQPTSK